MERMGSGAQSARLYRQDMRLREKVWWRGVGQHGMMRTAVATEAEGKIYRRVMWLSYDFGTDKIWSRGQPVPKATPVSFSLKTIRFSVRSILYFTLRA